MFLPRAEIGCFLLVVAGCAGCSRMHADSGDMTASPGTIPRHPTEIRQPPLPQLVLTGAADIRGDSVQMKCSHCHSVRPANVATTESAELKDFHQGLKMSHGHLTCGSCHQARDGYSTLKLADGQSVPFEESMMLCAQCHGTQFRDYQHGAHGGMTGYWDLSRGGRSRNHCQHCHDAHAPQYPTFTPVSGPRDRFPPINSGDTHE